MGSIARVPAHAILSRPTALSFPRSGSAPGSCADAPARVWSSRRCRLGYRHIDTAQIYENEREVGDGLRASGVKRDDVFVTTKVWTTHFAPNDLERSTKESLTKLRLSDVDLLLLHWPNPRVPLAETLGALAHVKQLGLARHIGVSNFTVALIEEAVAACPEPLVCDQVEYPSLSRPDQGQGGLRAQRHGGGRL